MAIYGIKDSGNITLIKNSDNKPVLYANYANKFDINFSSTPVYALKKGVKSISWDGQREGSLTTSMQVFDLKWIALLMGTSFEDGASTDRMLERKVVDVANATGTFTGSAVSGSMTVFKLDSDGITHDSEFTVTTESAVSAGKYKVASETANNVTTNTLTFPSGTTGKFVVYYLKAGTTDNKKFVVKIDEFPANYSMYADVQVKADGTGVSKMEQIYFPNIKPQSSVSISFDSENAATIDITFDILNGTDNVMMKFQDI